MGQLFENHNQSGFTLIELIVVIFILGIISSIIIANFRNGEKSKRVTIGADTIVDALRTAQEDALTGKNTSNSNANCKIPLYYFIDFSYSNSFTLSAYNNCDVVEQIQTYTLPTNTTIKSGSIKLNGLALPGHLKILFTLPFATSVANSVLGSFKFTSVSLVVQATDGSFTKTVTIDGISNRVSEQ